MNRRSKYGILLLALDKGGGSGGGATTASTSTATTANAGEIDLKTAFPGVDLDNLDDSSRAALEASAKQFATLQTNQQKAEEQARQFQSQHDKTLAELNRIRTSISGGNPPVVDPTVAAISEIEQTMIASGVDPKAAKGQAPIMHQLLAKQRENILAEVGRGVAPVTSMVMNHQAEQAFNYIRATDQTGAMHIPEVAQAVWNSCQEIAREGTPITNETVQNLKGMHFMAHAEKNPAVFATLQMNAVGGVVPQPATPPGSRVPLNVSTGGFNYPGSTFHASVPNNGAPANGAKTTLDAGTKAALQSIFGNMKAGHIVQ